MRALSLALALGVLVATGLVGCGHAQPTPAQLALEREDLIALAKALQSQEPQVARELADTKRAWPLVVNGLPRGSLEGLVDPVSTAARSAAEVTTPALVGEARGYTLTGPAASTTGPAAALAGLFRSYRGFSERGWRLTESAIEQIRAGERPGASPRTRAAARFARENVGLYIESVYDGHFELAQIEKKLRKAYANLGGPATFGSALTAAEMEDLASAYSEATARLHPHVGVKFGS